MAIGLFFQPSGFTPAIYEATIKELEDRGAGFGSVPGRTFHFAMEVNGSIRVFDVWESMEQFEVFAETVAPIMNNAGVEPVDPQIRPIYRMERG